MNFPSDLNYGFNRPPPPPPVINIWAFFCPVDLILILMTMQFWSSSYLVSHCLLTAASLQHLWADSRTHLFSLSSSKWPGNQPLYHGQPDSVLVIRQTQILNLILKTKLELCFWLLSEQPYKRHALTIILSVQQIKRYSRPNSAVDQVVLDQMVLDQMVQDVDVVEKFEVGKFELDRSNY